MKKITVAAILVLLLASISLPETREANQYVNLSFAVWELENGAKEAVRRINTPIPEILRDSWIYEFITFDVSEGKAATRIAEKDRFRFVLTAEPNGKLTIQVFQKETELFRLIHNRPATMDTIFYGSGSRAYLIEATYTFGDHPIGLLSPGILKK